MAKSNKSNDDAFSILNAFLEEKKIADTVKKKPDRWYEYPAPFKEATGIKGNPLGGIVQVVGWSDTGKTTDIITGIVACQKAGHIPVIIDTEKKFSFPYAVRMGLEATRTEEVDEETGEIYEKWIGNFIYRDDFESLEDLFRFISAIFDGQEKEVERFKKKNPNMPFKELEQICDKFSVCIVWDSAGTLVCEQRMKQGEGSAMMDAKAFGDLFKVRLASRIRETKKIGVPYWRSMIFVNQVYTGPKSNPYEADKFATKYGEAGKFMSDFQRRWGKISNSGTANVTISYKGYKINIGKVTSLAVEKNHDNGLSLAGNKICTLPHGLVENTKEAIEQYKTEHAAYLLEEIKKVISTLNPNQEVGDISIQDINLQVETED